MFIGIGFIKPNCSRATAAGDTFPDRSQVLCHERALIVLWKKMRVEKILFSHCGPPSNEKFSQGNEEDHGHDVLNREWIREVQRRMVQDQNRCSPREHDR